MEKKEKKSSKRSNEENMDETTAKKSNYDSSGENTYHLKMLIPSVAAGGVIGKGGETIAELQKSVGARVKMSKPNDFYPGTQERVCLITGNIDAISTIVHFINNKIKEKPDPHAKSAIDFDNKLAAEREKQMKVIVPNSTAGMIIGKGGCFIKHLKEKSGAFIQLSQKSKETTLPERVITIIGDDDNNKEALNCILQKVVEDPQSGSCLNISYSEIQGPVANFNPTGSPYANGVQNPNQNMNPNMNPNMNLNMNPNMNPNMNENMQNFMEGYHLPVMGGGTLNMRLNFNPQMQGGDGRSVNQYLGFVNNSLKEKGYYDKVADECTKAFSVLSMHGILQMNMLTPQMMGYEGGGMGGNMSLSNMLEGQNNHSNGGCGITDSIRANMGLPPPPPTPPSQGPFGPAGLVTVNESNGGFKRPSYSNYSNQSMPVNNNSFGLGTQGNQMHSNIGDDHSSKLEIEVNESLVGAIIGPGGRSIVEIQQYSGTTVQISKKGNYSPGTRNRIVTISGPKNCLSTAQYLIEQKVKEEEAKRQTHNQNMGF